MFQLLMKQTFSPSREGRPDQRESNGRRSFTHRLGRKRNTRRHPSGRRSRSRKENMIRKYWFRRIRSTALVSAALTTLVVPVVGTTGPASAATTASVLAPSTCVTGIERSGRDLAWSNCSSVGGSQGQHRAVAHCFHTAGQGIPSYNYNRYGRWEVWTRDRWATSTAYCDGSDYVRFGSVETRDWP